MFQKENRLLVHSRLTAIKSCWSRGVSRFFGVVFFLLLFTDVSAQKMFDHCLEDFKRVYQAWEKEIQSKKSNTIYLHYETDLVAGEQGNEQKNHSSVELISNPGKSIFLTKDLKVYEDKKHTVSILPFKKMIYINRYVGDETKGEKLKHFSFLKDTLFSELRVKECKQISIDKKPYKKVTLTPTATGKQLFSIEMLEVVFDEKLNTIKQVKVKYVKGGRLTSMKIHFIRQDLNYSSEKLRKGALLNVMDENGRLLSQYRGYQLIDNRK